MTQVLALLEQALSLDPDFAMAWMRLATIQLRELQDAQAASASVAKAARKRDRLSLREQLYLDALQVWLEGGDENEVANAWKLAFQMFPDSHSASHNVGLALLWNAHRPRESIAYFQVMIDADHPQRGVSLMNMGLAQLELGNTAQARELMDSGSRLGFMAPHFETVYPLLAARDYADALKSLGDGSNLPGPMAVERLLRFAIIRADGGEFHLAGTLLDDALRTARTSGAPPQIGRILLSQAALLSLSDTTAALQTVERAIEHEAERMRASDPRLDQTPAQHLAALATLATRLGDHSLGRRAISAITPPSYTPRFFSESRLIDSATCEVQHESPTQRSRCLSELVDGREYYQTHVGLMRVYAEMSATKQALEQAIWLVDNRGMAIAEHEGRISQM